MKRLLTRAWRALRTLTGDDAYQRYVEHVRRAHSDVAPLDAATFYREQTERRFSGGPSRCC
jgi:uncharacterized short protein YbdD (DUF466 family)